MKKINNNQNGFAHLMILAIIVVLLAIGMAGYNVWLKNNSKETTKDNVVSELDKNSIIQNNNKIYFVDSKKLYSVEAKSKKIVEVDSNVDSNGGGVGYGSRSPLMSPDMSTVAYVKNNSIWIKSDDAEIMRINQADLSSSTAHCYYHYISAWSSDSSKFTYSVTFDSGMGDSTCGDENKNITGVYVYKISDNTSKKIPINRADLWLPKTSRLVYFNNNNGAINLRTYDFESGKDEQLTKVGWEGTEPQIAFSSNGDKLIYAYQDYSSSASKIIMAKTDNTDKKILKEGQWAEYQWPRFAGDSTENYVYSHSEGWTCPDGSVGCPKKYVYSVVNGLTSKGPEIIDSIVGFYNNTVLIGVKGYAYNEQGQNTLSLINILNQDTEALYTGSNQLNSKMYWQ